jgi:hypothetical protein
MDIFDRLDARWWALEDSDRGRIKVGLGVILCFVGISAIVAAFL